MGNFNRGPRRDYGGGGGGRGRDYGGGGRGFGGGGRDNYDRPQMHKAICSSCNKECEVPFRPTGSKPVFCSDCFRNNKDAGGGGGFRKFEDRASAPVENHQYKEQLDAISSKLDKILEMLVPVPSPVLEEVEMGEVEVEKPKEKKAKATKKAPKKAE